jgi:hypothetical protein
MIFLIDRMRLCALKNSEYKPMTYQRESVSPNIPTPQEFLEKFDIDQLAALTSLRKISINLAWISTIMGTHRHQSNQVGVAAGMMLEILATQFQGKMEVQVLQRDDAYDRNRIGRRLPEFYGHNGNHQESADCDDKDYGSDESDITDDEEEGTDQNGVEETLHWTDTDGRDEEDAEESDVEEPDVTDVSSELLKPNPKQYYPKAILSKSLSW